MRFFELMNLQHVFGYLFPTLVFMLIFYVGQSYAHFKIGDGKPSPGHKFVDGLEKGHSPFPLIMVLIIAGTFIWGVAYILMYGFGEVRL